MTEQKKARKMLPRLAVHLGLSLKVFLNIVWSGLKPKDLTIMAVETKTSKFISFRTTGCLICTSFVEHSGEILNHWTKTETRCAAQKPLLIEERTAYAFGMNWLRT